MNPRQPNLTMLMGLVLVIALGLAGIKVASATASSLAITAGFVSCLVATLGAVVRRRRAGWIGYALFGWAYASVAVGFPAAWNIPNGEKDGVKDEVFAFWTVEFPLGQVVDRLHPEVTHVYPPAVAYNVRKVGGEYFSIVPPYPKLTLSPADVKIVDDYLDHEARRAAWMDASRNAYFVGISFQGIAFALCGALAARWLDDRRVEIHA